MGYEDRARRVDKPLIWSSRISASGHCRLGHCDRGISPSPRLRGEGRGEGLVSQAAADCPGIRAKGPIPASPRKRGGGSHRRSMSGAQIWAKTSPSMGLGGGERRRARVTGRRSSRHLRALSCGITPTPTRSHRWGRERAVIGRMEDVSTASVAARSVNTVVLAQALSCSDGELYDRRQRRRVSSFNQLVEIEFEVPTIGAAASRTAAARRSAARYRLVAHHGVRINPSRASPALSIGP
jgi:hypothetical protein